MSTLSTARDTVVGASTLALPSAFICQGHAEEPSLGLNINLAISLLESSGNRRFLVYPSRFNCRLEGVGRPAADYHLENWESGLISGALHALRRAKQSPDNTRVLVREFSGRIRGEDMDVLAQLAAQCVTALCAQNTTSIAPAGWRFSITLQDESVTPV